MKDLEKARARARRHYYKNRERYKAKYFYRDRRQRRDTEREETEKFIERFQKHEERNLQMSRMFGMLSSTPLAEILASFKGSNK